MIINRLVLFEVDMCLGLLVRGGQKVDNSNLYQDHEINYIAPFDYYKGINFK